MLIFLFISCSNTVKSLSDDDSAAVLPDGDEDVIDDEEFVDDEDEDTEPELDSCESNPCKNVENSNGECIAIGNIDYVCGCEKGYAWFGKEEGCLSIKIKDIYGAVCTGQTKCYDMEKEIPCPKDGEPFYGQDAQYAKAGKCEPINYTIKQYNNGETVIDNNSGLEWQKKVIPVRYGSFDSASTYCESYFGIGGHSDWRLPKPSEQMTIIDSGRYNPAINETYFPDTLPEFFYSNEYGMTAGFQHRETYMGGVDFKSGLYQSYMVSDIGGGYMPEAASVRCLRTAKKPADCLRKVIKNDDYEILLDLSNNLVFKNTVNSGKNWQGALDYCENLTYAGISDWRLPNRNEVNSALNDGSHYLWTSTTSVSNPAEALVSRNIYSEYQKKEALFEVQCVASSPCKAGKEIWNGKECKSFSELNLKEGGCNCLDGYAWEDSKCVELVCDNDCKSVKHSTGVCVGYSTDSTHCQCEEGSFYNYGGACVNLCDDDPCKSVAGSDGSCETLNYSKYTCGCADGYFSNGGSSCGRPENCTYTGWVPISVCQDSSSNLMWSSLNSSNMSWKAAKQYCSELRNAGYTDWRLPTVDELRTWWFWLKICENIKPDGKCKVSEKSGCLSESCMADCTCPDAAEDYETFMWSSSFVSDKVGYAFVLFNFSMIEARNVNGDTSGEVRCVRNID